MLKLIRGGGSPVRAALSIGIPARTHREWMRRGLGKDPRRPRTAQLRAYAATVTAAIADGGLSSEMRLHRDDPKAWLKHAGWLARDEEPEDDEASRSFKQAPGSSSFSPTGLASPEDAAEVLNILIEAGAFEVPAASEEPPGTGEE